MFFFFKKQRLPEDNNEGVGDNLRELRLGEDQAACIGT
jgi:hypothetical protein